MKVTFGLMMGIFVTSCSNHSVPMQFYPPIQLTDDPAGHTINSTQCWSPDGNWIVYDARNEDTQLAASAEIKMVHIRTKEQNLLYRTHNPTIYGPGVGAATFCPDGKKVLFLGGIANADSSHPYSTTRRTGIAVDLDHPMVPVPMDARDIRMPFTSGALRGGTHAHSWSGDGQWVSFTYNDLVLQEAATKYPNIQDLRTVGIMFPHEVTVRDADGVENKSGNMFAVLIADVTVNPHPGSDEVQKAFDECWIGRNGYLHPDGRRQKRAIAFQGNVRDKDGRIKTEIFVADIPENLPSMVDAMSLQGSDTTLPAVPAGITTRRISFLEKGISNTPRHWLRSTTDGTLIGFLAEDSKGTIQLWGISPNGGKVEQLTHLDASIEGPFNFSPDGQYAAYVSDGSIFITGLKDKKSYRITPAYPAPDRITGAVVWSPDGRFLCYNRYASTGGQPYLQIGLLERR